MMTQILLGENAQAFYQHHCCILHCKLSCLCILHCILHCQLSCSDNFIGLYITAMKLSLLFDVTVQYQADIYLYRPYIIWHSSNPRYLDDDPIINFYVWHFKDSTCSYQYSYPCASAIECDYKYMFVCVSMYVYILLVNHERSPIHLFCVFHLLYTGMYIGTSIQMENYDQLISIE